MLTDVRVPSKLGLSRGIVENDALLRAQDVVEDRLRQHGRARASVEQVHGDGIAAGGGFRRDPRFAPFRENQ
jgi:hypothetical protein